MVAGRAKHEAESTRFVTGRSARPTAPSIARRHCCIPCSGASRSLGPSHPPLSASGRRAGFTLIEVLVVMVIIAILVGITVSVVGNAIGNARVGATKGTITKISGLVQERVRAIDRAIQDGTYRTRIEQKGAQLGVNAKLASIIVMKEELIRAFYGTRSDSALYGAQATGALNYPPLVPANVDRNLESSKLLYAMLTSGSVQGVPPVDTDTFSSSEVLVDDNDPQRRPYFVDAWGNPLRFYLFPTRLVRPGGYDGSNTSGPGNPPLDPDDPSHPNYINRPLVRVLISASLSDEVLATDPHDPGREFAGAFNSPNAASLEARYHTPNTYHVPLIVSAGADRALGLREPHDVDTTANPPVFGHLAQPAAGIDLANPADSVLNDNVTNQQRAGGN